jgi:hypothetical protein
LKRLLIAKLERGGHDSFQARKLLALFEEMQAMYISDRNRLRRAFAKFWACALR